MQTSAPNRFTRNGKMTRKHDPPPQQILTGRGNVKHAQRVEAGLTARQSKIVGEILRNRRVKTAGNAIIARGMGILPEYAPRGKATGRKGPRAVGIQRALRGIRETSPVKGRIGTRDPIRE
jgi:hypothetical protein